MMTVTHMMLLRPPAYQEYLETKNMLAWARILVILLGLVYGVLGIAANYSFIMGFDSPLLQNVIAPLLFLVFGMVTVWITRIGLGLLLWAGAKAFGGPGKLIEVSRFSAVAIVPGVLGFPLLTGAVYGWPAYILSAVGLVWMFLLCTHILQVTQPFSRLMAAGASAAAFIFFGSILYMFIP
ncbi:hypothetical protein [Alkalicoccus saliphilus]|nr:hypothetical protein [Alkalicoccus saliphilus]